MKKVTSATRSPGPNLESTSTPGSPGVWSGTLFAKDDRIAMNTIHPQKLSVRLRENDQLRQDYNIDEMEHPIASFSWTSRRVGMARNYSRQHPERQLTLSTNRRNPDVSNDHLWRQHYACE